MFMHWIRVSKIITWNKNPETARRNRQIHKNSQRFQYPYYSQKKRQKIRYRLPEQYYQPAWPRWQL